jgi:hypothetical protein
MILVVEQRRLRWLTRAPTRTGGCVESSFDPTTPGRPMVATAITVLPTGAGWRYESNYAVAFLGPGAFPWRKVVGVTRLVMASAFLALCAASSSLHAQAPVPERLLDARTAFLVNEAGDLKRFDSFADELRKWGRFELVDRRDKADVVMTLRTIVRGQFGTVVNGSGSLGPIVAMTLEIRDRTDDSLLWNDTSPVVRSSGRFAKHLRERLGQVGPGR